MEKIDLIIQELQTELQFLQAELNEALNGIDVPDYVLAHRLQSIIRRANIEIERLEKLRSVRPAPKDFQSYFSRLLTDDTCSVLELWTQIKYKDDVTIRLLEIRKLKNSSISCMLRLLEPLDLHSVKWMAVQLQRLGWKALRGERTFYYKANMRSPDEFDAFCQVMGATLLEPLGSLWELGQQYYRYR